MRVSFARAAAAILAVLVALTGASPRADQDWRDRATASFEDAWQTVNDTYFDPTFGGVDWKGVRAELAPKVAAATTEDQVRDLIRDMIGRLHQSHFVLLAPAVADELPPGPATVPIEVRLRRGDVVITAVEPDSSAWRAGLRPGQIILGVDGVPLAALVGKPTDRTAEMMAWRRVVKALRGGDGTVARIELDPSAAGSLSRPSSLTVRRTREPGAEVTVGNLPAMLVRTRARSAKTPGKREVGVVSFTVWMAAVATPFAAAIDTYRRADDSISARTMRSASPRRPVTAYAYASCAESRIPLSAAAAANSLRASAGMSFCKSAWPSCWCASDPLGLSSIVPRRYGIARSGSRLLT